MNLKKDAEDKTTALYMRIRIRVIIIGKQIYRFFAYKNNYFFDTNMVVSNSVKDKRLFWLFLKNKRRFLTDNINYEIKELLKKEQFRKINNSKFSVVSFNDLRESNPELCPLYYNYILQMNNPAVVYSPEFFVHQATAILLKKRKFTDKEKIANNLIMDRLKSFTEDLDLSMKDIKGEAMPKSSELKFHRKKRKAIRENDPNYFNDLRSFSLMLLYCLVKRENVTFYTSDSDAKNLFFTLTEAIAYQCALTAEILSLLSDDVKKHILSGESQTFFVDPLKLAEKRMGFLGDIYSDNWKKRSFMFKIKYWSLEEKRYYSFDMTFNEQTRELFLNATGQYNCPWAQNNKFGSWLSIVYFWPPADGDDLGKMKVVVSKKSFINYMNSYIPSEVHDLNCLYAREDIKNNYSFFSSFIEA
jgi:hypothetical protein